MNRVPKSKKKRIQNKYIPKGVYCHDKDFKSCPYWKWREATDKDLIKIFDKEKKYLTKELGENPTFEDFKKYLKTIPEKEKSYFTNVYECACIHYTDYCQESLLFDECKECGRNEGNMNYKGPRGVKRMPNSVRRMSPGTRVKGLEEHHYKEVRRWLDSIPIKLEDENL